MSDKFNKQSSYVLANGNQSSCVAALSLDAKESWQERFHELAKFKRDYGAGRPEPFLAYPGADSPLSSREDCERDQGVTPQLAYDHHEYFNEGFSGRIAYQARLPNGIFCKYIWHNSLDSVSETAQAWALTCVKHLSLMKEFNEVVIDQCQGDISCRCCTCEDLRRADHKYLNQTWGFFTRKKQSDYVRHELLRRLDDRFLVLEAKSRYMMRDYVRGLLLNSQPQASGLASYVIGDAKLPITLSEDLKLYIDEIVDKLKVTLKDGVKINTSFDRFGDISSFPKIFTMFEDERVAAAAHAIIFSMLAMLKWKYPTSPAVNILIGMFAGFYMCTIVNGVLGPLIGKWFETRPQGLGDDIFTVCLEAITLSLFTKRLDFKDLKGFGSSMCEVEKHSGSLTKYMVRIKDWIMKVISLVCDYMGVHLNALSGGHQNALDEIERLIKEINSRYEESVGRKMVDYNIGFLFQRMDLLMLELETSMKADAESQYVRNVLNNYRRLVSPIRKMVEETSFVARPETGCLHICSHPGTGKTFNSTYVTERVSVAIMDKAELLDFEANPLRSTYSYPIGVKTYDTYNGQPIVILNDAFASTDAEGAESQATFVINACGVNDYMLPQADLPRKGRIRLLAKFMCINSNVTYLHTGQFKSIRNIDALGRRINKFCYYQTVKPQYWLDDPKFKTVSKELKPFVMQIDSRKVMADVANIDPETGVNFDTCLYYKWNLWTQKAVGKPITLDELCVIMENEMKTLWFDNEKKAKADNVVRKSFVKMRMQEIKNKEIQDRTVKPQSNQEECPDLIDSDSEDETEYFSELEVGDFDATYPYKQYYDQDREIVRAYSLTEIHNRVHKLSANDYMKPEDRVKFLFDLNQEYHIHDFLKEWLVICYEEGERIPFSQYGKPYLGDVNHPIHLFLDNIPMNEIENLVKTKFEDRFLLGWIRVRISCCDYFTATCAVVRSQFKIASNALIDLRNNMLLWFQEHPVISLFIAVPLALGIGCGVVKLIFAAISWFCSEDKTDAVKQIGEIREEEFIDIPPLIDTKPQYIGDVSKDGVFINSRLNNCWQIWLKRVYTAPDGTKIAMRIPSANLWFLGGQVAMLNWHVELYRELYSKTPGTSEVYIGLSSFKKNTKQCDYWFRAADVLLLHTIKEKDICFWSFPLTNSQTRITDWFPSNKDIEFNRFLENKNRKIDISLHVKRDGIPSEINTRMILAGVSSTYACNPQVKDPVTGVVSTLRDLGRDLPTVVHRKVWQLDCFTLDGDCNAAGFLTDRERVAYCNENSAYQHPVFAYFHNSINRSSMGMGVVVYKEDLEPIMKFVTGPRKSAEESIPEYLNKVLQLCASASDRPQLCQVEMVLDRDTNAVFADHHTVIGCLPELHRNTKSSIVGSCVKGFAPRTRNPVRLYDHDGMDLMEEARRDYGNNVEAVLPADKIRAVNQFVAAQIATDSPHKLTPKTLSYEEGIMGSPANCLPRLGMQTSPGPTLTMAKKMLGITGKGKTWIFGKGVDPDLSTPMAKIFRQLVEDGIEGCKNGERFPNLFGDNLKDELRPPEKLPRLFSSGDSPYLVACRMYLGTFAGEIYLNRIRNRIAIGINATSEEWDDAYNTLTSLSDQGIFGDFAKFDKWLLLVLIECTFIMARNHYGDSDPVGNQVREMLFQELVDGIHAVPDGDMSVIYKWLHGNSSGNFLTAIINSVANIVIHVYVICALLLVAAGKDIVTCKVTELPLKFVWVNTRMLTYGDDIGATVANMPMVTFQSVQRAIKYYFGLTYTDELKGDGAEAPPYRSVSECWFISRRFLKTWVNGRLRILSPLKKPSILEMPQWNKKKYSKADTIANAECASRQMSQWGPIDHAEFIGPLKEAIYKSTGVHMQFTDFQTALDAVMNEKIPLHYRVWSEDEDIYSGNSVWLVHALLEAKISDKLLDSSITKEELRVEPSETHPGCPSELDVYTNKTEILSSQESESKSDLEIEYQGAPKGEKKPLNCATQSSNVEERILGGTDVNEVITQAVSCDSARTTCWTEGQTEVKTKFDNPRMPTTIEVRPEPIEMFMNKPQYISSAQYTTTTASNANLYAIEPHTLLSSVTQWANKISGFGLVRGTFVLRLEMNAQPFNSGMLLIHGIPNYQSILANNNTSIALTHNANLVCKYQHPYIEMNCRQTVAEYRMPYIAPSSFYDVKTGLQPWGKIWVDAVTPMRTGSATQTFVETSVFGYWEDFELAACTVPQSNSREERETSGSISRGLREMSGAFKTMSRVSVLKPIMDRVSWATDIASGIAGAFGWAKPRLDTPPGVMLRQTARYTSVADAPDVSVPAGIIYKNQISVSDDWSITSEDEMSLKFLLKIPHYWQNLQWTTGNAPSTSLFNNVMVPGNLVLGDSNGPYGGHTATIVYSSPISYLANLFDLWRGDFEVTFKLVKTIFHTGKIMVVWTPGENVPTSATLANSLPAYRHIIDIREQDEFTLNLPWLLAKSYLRTDGNCSGRLNVIVLNDLRAPDTCSATIDIIILVRAGDNWEFQTPRSVVRGMQPYYPQSNSQEEIYDGGIADTKKEQLSTFYSEKCIGEHILSLKQFLNRNSQMVSLTASQPWSGNGSITIDPYFVSGTGINVTSGALTTPSYGADAFSWIAPLYAYMRGSVRWQIVTDGPTSTTGTSTGEAHTYVYTTPGALTGRTLTVPYAPNIVLDGLSGSFSPLYGTQAHYPLGAPNPDDRGPGISFYEFPYYCRYPVSHPTVANGLTYSTSDDTYPTTSMTITSNNALATDNQYYRSFSDNFTLSYFIGCPPLISSYV